MSVNTYNKILTKGPESILPSIEDGKLRFTTDTGRLFIDGNNTRTEITDFVKGMTEDEIKSQLAPLVNKIYIASDTQKMLQYDIISGWLTINADEATHAGTADYATNAGTSTYATNSGTATYGTNAGTAVHASTADYATSAGTSTYATNAGDATTVNGYVNPVEFKGTTAQWGALTNNQKKEYDIVNLTDDYSAPTSTDADDIDYNNTGSGLNATKVQGAIDEVLGKVNVTFTGTLNEWNSLSVGEKKRYDFVNITDD